jgi:electron-transferring-flavoprotein dehydrogenase
VSRDALGAYDRTINSSYVVEDLRQHRNMRLAFHDSNVFVGGFKAVLMTLTKGAFPKRKIDIAADSETAREPVPADPFVPDGKLTFSKVDVNHKSGNATRDDIPTHLLDGEDVPSEVAEMYERLCPADVYARQNGRLVINAPNCIDCKATDVLEPRWTPREGASGPHYRMM